MTEKNTNTENENPAETETGEANYSIVRYFKYVLLLGILSFVGLGALAYFLIWIFSN